MSKAAPGQDALDPDKIKSHLKTERIGKKVIVYSSTASTNDVAGEYARNRDNDGLVVLAEEQASGRGRGGNKWFGSRGDSILCSILLTECKVPSELLSLTCAVATAEAVGKCAKAEAKIKWPNDIILNGKKMAGILVESKNPGKHTAYVIGIGINCHQKKQSFPAELQKTATSIDIETGSVTDRISLIRRLLTSVDHWLDVAEKNKEEVIERWRRLSSQLGHRVSLIYNRRKFSGNCIGIDPQQGLIVQLDTDGIRMFHAAQTTIAK
ncbi:MAG: biotin--[acetyl-CoA-carboxylase] ligase [Sedimentisphaerales bacterium]|nr:biotin--[acetyl-CoA-carboxylase] ligase [Sedimentisphaerales bacterium]